MRRIGIVILLMLFFVYIMNCAMAEESCSHENLSALDVRNIVGTPVVVGQSHDFHCLCAPEAEVLWMCDDCHMKYDEYEVAYEVEYIDSHAFIGDECDFCKKYVDLAWRTYGTCTICGLCFDSDHDALKVVATPDQIDENGRAHFNFEITNHTEYLLMPWLTSSYAISKTIDEYGRFQYGSMKSDYVGYEGLYDGLQPGETITVSEWIEIDEQWRKNGFVAVFLADFRHDGRVYRAHGGIEEWSDIQDNSSALASEESVLEWLKSVEGTQLDYDGIYPGECVDLIGEYYNFLGVEQTGGDAKDYATRPAPKGMIKIPDCDQPQCGDVLVYLNEPYGHVAIYESEYVSWHQNLNEIRVVKRWDKLHYKNNGLNYWGVIRPNLEPEGDVPPITDNNETSIHIYSQWDEDYYNDNHTTSRWWNVWYEHGGAYKGELTNLYVAGCGVFAMAHITQALGLEPKDINERLPAVYAELVSGHCTCHVAGEGINAICQQYGLTHTYFENGVSKDRFIDELVGGRSAFILHPPGHWNAALKISDDRQYVLVADSCIYPYKTSGRAAYTYNADLNRFIEITDWRTVTRASATHGNGYGDGIMDGGALYWIEIEDALDLAQSSFLISDPSQMDETEDAISVVPDFLDFGTVHENVAEYWNPISRKLIVRNDGNRAITLNTDLKEENYRFGFGKTTLNSGEQTEVWISPIERLEPGVHDTTISVGTVGGQPVSVEVNLALTVEAEPEMPVDLQCPYCDEGNTEITNRYYTLYEGEWTDNKDGTHSGMAVLTGWVYCEECDDGFEIELAEPALHVGRHEFEDGWCWDCELDAIQCDHTYEDYELANVETVFSNSADYLDEGFHHRSYISVLHYACTICGEEYTETHPMGGDEAHHYDEKGFCICGSTGEPTNCDHLNWEPREYEDHIRYSEITATEHTKTADIYSGKWCLDCQTQRTRQLWTPNEVTVERHTFVEGICECGYAGGCIEHLYMNEICVSCGEHYLEGLENIYWLPAKMTQIQDEAFFGVPVQAAVIPNGCMGIGMRAFAECTSLKRIVIPESVLTIATDAFDGCIGFTILAPEGSYAQQYAQEQGYLWNGFE